MRHLASIHDLSDEDLRLLLRRARGMAEDLGGQRRRLDGRVICTAFFEPSTRTRLSFEAAAHRLGARVIGFSDPATTSSSKGETLEDTIRMLAGYSDLVVMRHPKEGAAKRAVEVSSVPIVNAGDGSGEHPTQTLVDLYTILECKGRIDGLRVALVGDLKFGRTVHSLLPALRRMGAEPVAVAAHGLELPLAMAKGVPTMGLEEAARTCDVLYATRIQKERFVDPSLFELARGTLRIDVPLLERTASKAIVLHPLPRVDEIGTDVDAHPAAKYFDQARNAVPVRMAVLAALLGDA